MGEQVAARILNESKRKRSLNLVRGVSRHLVKPGRRRRLSLVERPARIWACSSAG